MNASPLEEFFADLFGEDTAVVLGDTGVEVSLAEFLNLASLATGGAFEDDVAPPKRDTPEYRKVISSVARNDSLDEVISSLKHLYADYGWRAVLDVMAEWVGCIEMAPLTQNTRYRDLTGVVDLSVIVMIDATEEQALRIAADKQARLQDEQGLAPHLAFQKGLADTEAGLALTRRWRPYFRAALAAAHTTGDRRAVVAELFRVPGRNDVGELLRGAMVLGTAAYGVRHQHAMTQRFEAVADGREAIHDPSVTPGWNGGGGFMRRSTLRHQN